MMPLFEILVDAVNQDQGVDGYKDIEPFMPKEEAIAPKVNLDLQEKPLVLMGNDGVEPDVDLASVQMFEGATDGKAEASSIDDLRMSREEGHVRALYESQKTIPSDPPDLTQVPVITTDDVRSATVAATNAIAQLVSPDPAPRPDVPSGSEAEGLYPA
jgi:hypothetical protein